MTSLASKRTLVALAAIVIAGGALFLLWRGGGSSPTQPTLQPAARRGFSKAIWGPVQLRDGRSAFGLYSELGVDTFQMQLQWDQVAAERPSRPRDPSDTAYRWPRDLSRALVEGRRRGIEVAVLVRGSPPWANGGRGPAWVPERRRFADFLVAASRRYPGVHKWMIWGETTRAGNLRPAPAGSPVGPRAYAVILDAAYEALKSVDPGDAVIGGMTWTVGTVYPADFVRWMRLPSGRPPRMDLFGHNPFSTRFPDLARRPYVRGLRDFSDLDTFHAEIARRYRRSGMPVPRLWLAEFNVSSDRGSRGFAFFVSRTEQARWLKAAFAIGQRAPWIAGIGWYSLLDEPSRAGRGLTTGLLTSDGARKPAFFAYRSAAIR